MARGNHSRGKKAFSSFVLDQQRGVLTQSGRDIPLRPKTYAVLEYFVDHPKRLISKEELIKAVWSDTVVTDDSLTHCVLEIRKALGDTDRQLIKTVPKRGFTFDATVTDDSANSRVRAKRLAAGSVLVALVGAYVVFSGSSESTVDNAPQNDFVAIPDIVADIADADSSAQLLGEALRLRLDELEGLSIRSGGPAGFENTQPQLDELRSRGIDWAITGAIDSVSGSETHRVRFWLWDVGTEAQHSLGVFSIPENADLESTSSVVALRDLVVERALGRLPSYVADDSTEFGFPERLADFETYAHVMTELEKEQCNASLAPMMQPVVENTPNFLRGWMALAWSHWVDYWACSLGDDSLHGAIDAADRVLALQPNYPQAVKVKTSALAAMRDVEAALQLADAVTQATPYEAAMWSTLSYLLNYVGDLDESERAMDRALAIDPLVLVAETGETPNVYLYVGKWQRYLDNLPPFNAPFFNFQRAYAHFRNGDPAEALRIARQTHRDFPADLYTRFGTALIAIIEGQHDAASNVLNGIAEERDFAGNGDGEVAYREAILFMLASNPDRALDRLHVASELNFVCPSCVRRDPAWRIVLDSEGMAAWLGANEAL